MNVLTACPFCGGTPSFSSLEYKDDNRYCEIELECCVTLSESMGYGEWKKHPEDMRESILKERLTERWNTRYVEDED